MASAYTAECMAGVPDSDGARAAVTSSERSAFTAFVGPPAPVTTKVNLERRTPPSGKASSRKGSAMSGRAFQFRIHDGKELVARDNDRQPGRKTTDGLGRVENREKVSADPANRARQRLKIMREGHARKRTKAKPGYLDEAPPGSLQAHDRENVVQYIFDVVADFEELESKTAGLAIGYFDRYVSAKESIVKDQVQLLASTCVLIAAKFSETRMPSLDDLCEGAMRKYSVPQIKSMEIEVLLVLQWELHDVIAHEVLEQLVIAIGLVSVEAHVPPIPACGAKPCLDQAEFFVDMSLFEYDALQFSPLVVASAGLLCAWNNLGHVSAAERHVPLLSELCGADRSEIRQCVEMLTQYFEACRRADDRTESPDSVMTIDAAAGVPAFRAEPCDFESARFRFSPRLGIQATRFTGQRERVQKEVVDDGAVAVPALPAASEGQASDVLTRVASITTTATHVISRTTSVSTTLSRQASVDASSSPASPVCSSGVWATRFEKLDETESESDGEGEHSEGDDEAESGEVAIPTDTIDVLCRGLDKFGEAAAASATPAVPSSPPRATMVESRQSTPPRDEFGNTPVRSLSAHGAVTLPSPLLLPSPASKCGDTTPNRRLQKDLERAAAAESRPVLLLAESPKRAASDGCPPPPQKRAAMGGRSPLSSQPDAAQWISQLGEEEEEEEEEEKSESAKVPDLDSLVTAPTQQALAELEKVHAATQPVSSQESPCGAGPSPGGRRSPTRIVSPEGSFLHLAGSYSDVQVSVPAGAATCVGILDMTIRGDVSPALSRDGQIIVSPVLQCVPRRTEIGGEVTVRLPHCSAGPLEQLEVWHNPTYDLDADAWVRVDDIVQRNEQWVEFRTPICATEAARGEAGGSDDKAQLGSQGGDDGSAGGAPSGGGSGGGGNGPGLPDRDGAPDGSGASGGGGGGASNFLLATPNRQLRPELVIYRSYRQGERQCVRPGSKFDMMAALFSGKWHRNKVEEVMTTGAWLCGNFSAPLVDSDESTKLQKFLKTLVDGASMDVKIHKLGTHVEGHDVTMDIPPACTLEFDANVFDGIVGTPSYSRLPEDGCAVAPAEAPLVSNRWEPKLELAVGTSTFSMKLVLQAQAEQMQLTIERPLSRGPTAAAAEDPSTPMGSATTPSTLSACTSLGKRPRSDASDSVAGSRSNSCAGSRPGSSTQSRSGSSLGGRLDPRQLQLDNNIPPPLSANWSGETADASDSSRTVDVEEHGEEEPPPAKSPRKSPTKSPPPLDLLMLASNPDGAPGGALGEVTREAHELRHAMPNMSFEPASSPAQLGKLLGTVPARIIVYSGHGDARLSQHGPCTLCFTAPSGDPALVEPDTLRDVFRGIAARRTLQLVVLNGCDTLALGKAVLEAGVPFVLCWESSVPDEVARLFVVAFIKAVQQQITQGLPADYEAALDLAKSRLSLIVRPGHNSHGQAFNVPKWEFRAPQLQTNPWTGHVKDVSVSTADFTPAPEAAGVPCLLKQPTPPNTPTSAPVASPKLAEAASSSKSSTPPSDNHTNTLTYHAPL